MRKLLFILLVAISTQAYSQVYTLRVIHVNGNVIDSLYAKDGGEDTLWRHDGNVYNMAYVAKQWAYFPFFQPIDPPTTLAGYGITDALTTSQVTAAYQPIGNYASGATNTGDNATNTQYSGLAASKQATLVSGTNIKTVNGNTLLGSGDLVVSGGAGLGYTLSVQALTSSPADGATIYFGQLPKAPTTSANISKIYIRKAGTIKMVQLYCYSGTAGTAEAWVANIRLNNTTDTQIASVAAAASERIFTNSSLNIPVVAGDYIEIKLVNPTWATNPLTTIFGGYIYIE